MLRYWFVSNSTRSLSIDSSNHAVVVINFELHINNGNTENNSATKQSHLGYCFTEVDGFQQTVLQANIENGVSFIYVFFVKNHRVTMPDFIFCQTIQRPVQLYIDYN